MCTCCPWLGGEGGVRKEERMKQQLSNFVKGPPSKGKKIIIDNNNHLNTNTFVNQRNRDLTANFDALNADAVVVAAVAAVGVD